MFKKDESKVIFENLLDSLEEDIPDIKKYAKIVNNPLLMERL